MSFSERFEQFVRSLISDSDPGENRSDRFDRSGFGGYTLDPDYSNAMDELEHFIETGFDPEPKQSPGAGSGGKPRSSSARHNDAVNPPGAVLRAFRALEAEPGSDFDQVTRSYKRLVQEYHPDKHAWDRERAEAANEVTKRLNLAYRAVRDYYLVIGKIDP